MIPKHPAASGLKIGRDQILAKYWELANLDPQDTKGSITGQLSALDALLELLPSANETTKPLPTREVYRSAWMDSKPRVH
jgi:hypothetical protein